ncbi:MAG TPA: hypothetical protein VHZ26_20145 [Caulobacteraceae bacterium]|nr:hypothetical protein [Caulobacteraceae bacterium]
MRLDFGSWWHAFHDHRPPIRRIEPPSNRRLDEPYRPTDRATVLRPIDPTNPVAGLESVDRRWWLVPASTEGRSPAGG